MTAASLAAFVLASALLAVTPGPGVVYIVTRTLVQGRCAGWASVAGVALGNLLNAAGASLGLAALLALSRTAFTLLQVAGALYLFWLGAQALRATTPTTSRDHAASPHVPAHAHVWPLFRDGALVALLNPKTALFFAAFLPQFMSAGSAAWPQAMALGALFVGIAACSDAIYVALAARLAPKLLARRGARSGARLAAAAVYLSLGLATLVTGTRQPR